MLEIKEYVKAESLEQAYELNQKRTNCILGGMLWLKMSNRNVQKAIDLSGLGLNQIEETEEEFRIGCMTTLRELECHERLNQWCEGAVKDAVSDIVGVPSFIRRESDGSSGTLQRLVEVYSDVMDFRMY